MKWVLGEGKIAVSAPHWDLKLLCRLESGLERKINSNF